jgi:hypothetical protein
MKQPAPQYAIWFTGKRCQYSTAVDTLTAINIKSFTSGYFKKLTFITRSWKWVQSQKKNLILLVETLKAA